MGAGCSGKASDIIAGSSSDIPRFKIVLVGDVEVGKTSIFLRYFKNQFDYSYRPTTTVSIENVVKKLNVPENTIVSIAIWDLPGREEVDLRKSYYKDVDAAVVVVNISDPESVELAGTWRQDILNHAVFTTSKEKQTRKGQEVITDCTRVDSAQIPVLLLGNKFDIIEDKLAMRDENLNKESDEDTSRSKEEGSTSPDHQGAGTEEEVHPDVQLTQSSKEEEKTDLEGKASMEDEENAQESIEEGKDQVVEQMKGNQNHSEGQEQAEEEKPEEVVRLEECSNQHGFVGCVAVSVKESDGGVHAAIQALVRHLIERKLKDQAEQKMDTIAIRRPKQRILKLKKPRLDEYVPLESTEVPQIDSMFKQCNPSLQLVHETKLAYEQAMQHFKNLCLENGIVSGKKSSIEDCIVGIRKVLAEEELELLVQEKEGFVELDVKGKEMNDAEKIEQFSEIINTFHSEVWVACRTVIIDCPTAVETLKMQDSAVVSECSVFLQEYINQDPKFTANKANIISEKIDMNRARMKLAQITVTEMLQEVESLATKIKAAMIW